MTSHIRSLGRTLLLALGLACGSEDGSLHPPAPRAETPFRAGPLVGATIGPVGITTTSSNRSLVTGFNGRFTRLDYQTEGSENDFPIYTAAIRRTPGPVSHIYRILAGTGDPVQVTNGSRNEYHPSLDPSGSRIAYWEGNAQGEINNGLARLMVMPAGGGEAVPVDTIETISRYRPAWSPDGQSLLFPVQDTMGFVNYLVRLTLPTRVLDTLYSTTSGIYSVSAGMLDGIPTVIVPGPDGFMTVRLTTGDTATILGDMRFNDAPYLAPDGKSMAFRHNRDLIRVSLPGYTDPRVLGDVDTWPLAWLPNGSGFVLTVNTGIQPYALQLFEWDTLGVLGRQITDAPLEFGSDFTIGPRSLLAPSSQLIGPAALLADSASGILVGQGQGTLLASVLAFDAADPATARAEAMTGLNSTAPFLTVSLTADRITRLAHLDLRQGVVTLMVDGSSPAVMGALVTFNADDGTVALVLTYGGEGPPTIRDDGAVRIFTTRDSVIRLD